MAKSLRKDFEIAPGAWIGNTRPVFVIAEIGQNHQGDISIAKEMIKMAKSSGADCVKFQKSSLGDKFTGSALDRPYSSRNSFGATYGEHKKVLEFTDDQYQELLKFCQDLDIPMTASGMDEKSVLDLYKMAVPFIKIGSGDSNNLLLLETAAKLTGTPFVISTGMSDLRQVRLIYQIMKKWRENSNNNFALLQCTSSYPTAAKDCNLLVLDQYRAEFPDVHLGFSGHEIGYIPTLGAVAKGAKIIERHVTLDKSMKGSDHACSLDFGEFSEMVRAIRKMELALGKPEKSFLQCEEACFQKLGKSVVALRTIPAGQKISIDDLCIKVAEPHGWPALEIKNLAGKIAAKTLKKDDSITPDCVV